MAWNNNRGGYGNRQNNQGGGYQNNRGGGGYNRGGGRGANNSGGADLKYVRSSFFSKALILEGEDGRREPQSIEPGVTEEFVMTLSPEKTQQLLAKLNDAINDPSGDGGVRITTYCQHKINKQDNSEFDGASILVVGKFPPKNQNGYGGQKGGNGRRQYPDRANSGTGQSGQQSRGHQTQDSRDTGHTQSATNGASHSDESYTENNGW